MARDYYDRNRNMWDRGRDEVRSWFGDEDAERRRDLDSRREDWDYEYESGGHFRNPYREAESQRQADREFDRDWDLDTRPGRFDDYRSQRPVTYGARSWGRRSRHQPWDSSTGSYGREDSFGREDFSGRGPSGYRRSDERLLEELNDRLTWDWSIDATDVSVEVRDGVATLNGRVRDRRMKRRAEDVADSIRGISDVHNRLQVSSPGSASEHSETTQT